VLFRSWPSSSGHAESGYRIHLSARTTGAQALGRASGFGRTLTEVTFTPPPAAPAGDVAGGWQHLELRVERRRLTASINGAVTTTAEALEEFAGHVAVRATRGKVQFRQVQIQDIPPTHADFGNGALTLDEPGIRHPKVIKEVSPRYTADTLRERVQGTVDLMAVVLPDGTVGDVRLSKSLHHDLDRTAVAAARQWIFEPAMKDGKPVAVIVTITLWFRITPR
jgi:TonB family protein